MVQRMKKRGLAVCLVLLMCFTLTACGGKDTKESMEKVVTEASDAMKSAMQDMGTALMGLMSAAASGDISGVVNPFVESIDKSIENVNKIETPGDDSAKFKDYVVKMLNLMKDMFKELGELTDVTDTAKMEEIQNKYNPQIQDLTKEMETFITDMDKKYGTNLKEKMESSDQAAAPEAGTTDDGSGEVETTDDGSGDATTDDGSGDGSEDGTGDDGSEDVDYEEEGAETE